MSIPPRKLLKRTSRSTEIVIVSFFFKFLGQKSGKLNEYNVPHRTKTVNYGRANDECDEPIHISVSVSLRCPLCTYPV